MTKLPEPDVAGVCPHCGHDVVFLEPSSHKGSRIYSLKMEYSEPKDIYSEKMFLLVGCRCPNKQCGKLILIRKKIVSVSHAWEWEDDIMIWPRGIVRPIPEGFSPEIERNFKEACGTLYTSKRASAALSRRCLQNLLREKEGVHKNTLHEEIKDVLNTNALPTPLQDTLHMIRNLGNIATHPLKDKVTGKIFDVEEGEAELMINALTDLLDYYDRLRKYGATANAAGQKVASQQRPPKKK